VDRASLEGGRLGGVKGLGEGGTCGQKDGRERPQKEAWRERGKRRREKGMARRKAERKVGRQRQAGSLSQTSRFTRLVSELQAKGWGSQTLRQPLLGSVVSLVALADYPKQYQYGEASPWLCRASAL